MPECSENIFINEFGKNYKAFIDFFSEQVLFLCVFKAYLILILLNVSGIGIGVTDQGKFSTYLHALMELNLAVAELNKPTGRSKGGDLSLSLEMVPRPPTSPTHTSRRKKLKTKRDRRDSAQKRDDARRTSESEAQESGQPSSASSSAASLLSLVSSASDPSVAASTSGASSSSTSQDKESKEKEKDVKESKTTTKVAKPEDELWLHRALIVSHILRCLAFNEKNGMIALVNAIADAHQVLNTVTAHQRLVIITGIPTNLEPDFVKQALRSIFKSHGGVDRDEIYLPYQTVETVQVKEVVVKDDATGETETKQVKDTGEQVESEAVEGVDESKKEDVKDSNQTELKKEIKREKKLNGYAVVSVMSKTKVESIKKSLSKSNALFEGASLEQDDPIEVPTITTVAPNLIAEEQSNEPLEKYLQYKFFQDKNHSEICDNATVALTEIFTSCFIVEQKHGSPEFRQESGYICLSKEQILQHTPENLLCAFFSNIRPPKKSLPEQVLQVLRRYGMVFTPDKEGYVFLSFYLSNCSEYLNKQTD